MSKLKNTWTCNWHNWRFSQSGENMANTLPKR